LRLGTTTFAVFSGTTTTFVFDSSTAFDFALRPLGAFGSVFAVFVVLAVFVVSVFTGSGTISTVILTLLLALDVLVFGIFVARSDIPRHKYHIFV
jgi:hypothetical protein